MTDYETAYRALREGLEALHVEATRTEGGNRLRRPICSECRRFWPCPSIALLASSPAEGTGEACAFCRGCHPAELDHCINLPGCPCPAPVSSGEAALPTTMLRPVGCICGGEDGACSCEPSSGEAGDVWCLCGHLADHHDPEDTTCQSSDPGAGWACDCEEFVYEAASTGEQEWSFGIRTYPSPVVTPITETEEGDRG